MQTTISSGKWRGKKWALPDHPSTRPTKSLVAKSVIDTIRPNLANSAFVEAFGGSGFMAALAVSNYAKSAIAIEKDKLAFEVIKRNFASLSGDGDGGLKAILGDTFEILPSLLTDLGDFIIYFDPPFNIRDGFSDVYQKLFLMASAPVFNRAKIIVLEHISSFNAPNFCGELKLQKTKKFGNTSVSYYANAE